ncbi:hypothetical protein RYA99_09430 [Pseudomonas syringae pv. actinidifoliorum]|nr:hypothetical protein [Pseudomonas syringae pv. actinidifoliorum]MDU8523652.1 hypothetical protein [Pseudomonas syringae pv. actinidifoliorum]MDU8526395.1 hypothetical protein [Pseudomonas syringae pv. actinidifoliorum]
MNQVKWFSVSNPDGKRFPEWRRSFGVGDNGTVFVPSAMAGSETEVNVMLCALADRQRTATHLNHHFVPSDWLKNEFPKHFELIEIIETRAQTAFSDLDL